LISIKGEVVIGVEEIVEDVTTVDKVDDIEDADDGMSNINELLLFTVIIVDEEGFNLDIAIVDIKDDEDDADDEKIEVVVVVVVVLERSAELDEDDKVDLTSLFFPLI
jgi:hypothetical protein